ncbi:FAD-dependent monooxygenase [Advenella alkanexedens]|uniref:FAD-dependent monooxygenase n=1 Tax=Advenella alkanexedens TaxID=1481665 RepID=A0ABS6NQ32_9BURK|nr:FAD-dependent monooxygenase [Advenella alkanexedens]MBV4397731.1 FAD-dependent monooxygenase [Advenella alkanexedens]
MIEENVSGYKLPRFEYRKPADFDKTVQRYPVVIVGGGLAGLTLAADLSTRGIAFVLLDEDDTVGVKGASSRGIVYAQKSLEIFDRLGIYEKIAQKGVAWSVGKSLVGQNDIIYEFDAAKSSQSLQPPFLNIQQFYIEWFLVERINELKTGEIRWKSRVIDVEAAQTHSRIKVETPDGTYWLEAEWLVDCCGLASGVREKLGLETFPEKGTERWCISDIRFKKELPLERWTWVESPVNDGRAVWQHPMADGVWRIDFQMKIDSDVEYISRPDVCEERVRKLLGHNEPFELVWVGPWASRTHLLDNFKYRRVLFAGDSAHVFPPLGARGGNSGIQDADNLGWKLALVLKGQAQETLLNTYSQERRPAAIHNMDLATRSVRFLSPQGEGQRILRNAVIALAKKCDFAQAMVNTGRLSTAFSYQDSDLSIGAGESIPNLALELKNGQKRKLVDYATDSQIMLISRSREVLQPLQNKAIFKILIIGQQEPDDILDVDEKIADALGIRDGSIVILRPDLHVLARFKEFGHAQINELMHRINYVEREE